MTAAKVIEAFCKYARNTDDTPRQIATRIGVPVKTLRTWRKSNKGRAKCMPQYPSSRTVSPGIRQPRTINDCQAVNAAQGASLLLRMIERSGFDSNEHLIVCRFRQRTVDKSEAVGSAICLNFVRFHKGIRPPSEVEAPLRCRGSRLFSSETHATGAGRNNIFGSPRRSLSRVYSASFRLGVRNFYEIRRLEPFVIATEKKGQAFPIRAENRGGRLAAIVRRAAPQMRAGRITAHPGNLLPRSSVTGAPRRGGSDKPVYARANRS